jgi:hypothetical protein
MRSWSWTWSGRRGGRADGGPGGSLVRLIWEGQLRQTSESLQREPTVSLGPGFL